MLKFNLFKSKDQLLLVSETPNLGWVYTTFFPTSHNIITMYSTSHANITDYLKECIAVVYPRESISVRLSPNHAIHFDYDNNDLDLSKNTYKIDQEYSQGLLKRNMLMYLPDDTDSNNIKFKDFMKELSAGTYVEPNIPEDITPTFVDTADWTSHRPWSSKALDQNNLFVYKSPTKKTDPVYKSRIKSKIVKEMIEYLSYDSPLYPHKNLLLVGPAGTTKTKMAEVLAAHFDLPYAIINANQRMETEDFYGSISIGVDAEGDSSWYSQMTRFCEVAQAGGIAAIDEFTLLSGASQSGLNSVLFGTTRSIEFQGKKYLVSPKTIFVAMANIGYEGNGNINFSFKDRFRPFKVDKLTDEEVYDYYQEVFPKLPDHFLKNYISLCRKVDSFLQTQFDDADDYSAETPELTVRRMNDLLGEYLVKNKLAPALESIVAGILSSPSFTSDNVRSVMSHVHRDIAELDAQLDASLTSSLHDDSIDIDELDRFIPQLKKKTKDSLVSDEANDKSVENSDVFEEEEEEDAEPEVEQIASFDDDDDESLPNTLSENISKKFINLKGMIRNVDELETIENPKPGDAYILGDDVYVYSETDAAFIKVLSIEDGVVATNDSALRSIAQQSKEKSSSNDEDLESHDVDVSTTTGNINCSSHEDKYEDIEEEQEEQEEQEEEYEASVKQQGVYLSFDLDTDDAFSRDMLELDALDGDE